VLAHALQQGQPALVELVDGLDRHGMRGSHPARAPPAGVEPVLMAAQVVRHRRAVRHSTLPVARSMPTTSSR
jgi:hypothetical protein